MAKQTSSAEKKTCDLSKNHEYSHPLGNTVYLQALHIIFIKTLFHYIQSTYLQASQSKAYYSRGILGVEVHTVNSLPLSV